MPGDEIVNKLMIPLIVLDRSVGSGMFHGPGSVGEGSPDIIALEEIEISQNFFLRHSSSQHLQDIADGYAHSTNAWTTAAFAGFYRYA